MTKKRKSTYEVTFHDGISISFSGSAHRHEDGFVHFYYGGHLVYDIPMSMIRMIRGPFIKENTDAS